MGQFSLNDQIIEEEPTHKTIYTVTKLPCEENGDYYTLVNNENQKDKLLTRGEGFQKLSQ